MTALSRLAAVTLVAALAAAPLQTLAQYPPPQRYSSYDEFRPHAELTAIAGYQLNTDVDTTGGELSMDDAPVYGASLAFVSSPGLRAQLLWLYSNPTAHAFGSTFLTGSAPFHVPTHYFQIGGTRGVRYDQVEPFAGGTLGAALFMPGRLEYANGTTTSLGDTWRFAFTLGGGLNVYLSEKLALRGEARVAAPVYFSSGSIYVGGGGAALGVSGGIPIWQWNFLGALVFSP